MSSQYRSRNTAGAYRLDEGDNLEKYCKKMKPRYLPFIRKNSALKILVDIFVMVILWIILIWVLPRNALFFHISNGQTTTPKLIFTIVMSTIFVVFFRLLVKNYGKTWSNAKALDILSLLVSDAIAGFFFYVFMKKIVCSQYPFLLFVAIYSINCLVSLFIRLLYMELNDVFDITDS